MLPFMSDAEEVAFRSAFYDEIIKMASIPDFTRLAKRHAPGALVGAAGLHYGKQAVTDYQRGRMQRKAMARGHY